MDEIGRLLARVQEQDAEIARLRDDLDTFATSVSHDLSGSLRAIVTQMALLRRRYGGQLDSGADEFIDFAMDGGKRVQEIVGGLVAYARVGSRGRPIVAVDATSVLSQTLAQLAAAIELTGARIHASPLPKVMADPEQLGMLFRILVANAIEYRGEASPVVRVDSHRDGQTICLAISDNGCGFDMAHADRIFRLCQRLHTQAEHPGAGIGLAIARRIVNRHGGRIWAESAPGQGATFRFTLHAA